jgi:Pyrimidine dimer DNA glycosylase
MQSFLPYSDFERSARVLDWRRLGKQRVEALQILNVLTAFPRRVAWDRHSAVLMWTGHERALRHYLHCVVREWIRRGYVNNISAPMPRGAIERPAWLGRRALHDSHRSRLLRKDPVWYSQFGWRVPPDLEYWWPTKELDASQRLARNV